MTQRRSATLSDFSRQEFSLQLEDSELKLGFTCDVEEVTTGYTQTPVISRFLSWASDLRRSVNVLNKSNPPCLTPHVCTTVYPS